MIGDRQEAWHPLCNAEKVLGCRIPQFLDNKTLIVSNQDGFTVMGADGQLQLRQKYNFLDAWIAPLSGPIHSSRNGTRFAVVLNHFPITKAGALNGVTILSGTIRFAVDLPHIPGPLPARVDIYDPASQTWIASFVNKNNKLNEIFGFALSPSGGNMAVDSGGTIHIYSLPPATEDDRDWLKIR